MNRFPGFGLRLADGLGSWLCGIIVSAIFGGLSLFGSAGSEPIQLKHIGVTVGALRLAS